jgi:hypothetical protein
MDLVSGLIHNGDLRRSCWGHLTLALSIYRGRASWTP